MDPDKAVDAALDALCVLTGTLRRGASASVVPLALTGEDATLVPAGSIVRIPNGARFLLDTDTTTAAVDAWGTLTVYALADRVTSSANVYQCTEAGTSGSDGPDSVDPLEDVLDGSAHWRFLGVGVAAGDVNATAENTGPTIANSGTMTEIVSPVGGWDGVVNTLDATPGRAQMTNPELRVLRELELAQPGTSPVDAVRAALLQVTGVISATIFANNTDTTDADGVPPHSLEALVQGGDDQDIYDTLLANVAAGIRTHGLTTGSSTDSQGFAHVMKLSRVTEIPVYVRVDVIKDPVTYPADGDTQIKEAIVAWGLLQNTGKDGVSSAIGARAFDVRGVNDVTLCYIDDAPVPTTSTTIPVSLRQRAVYDTLRITVNSTNGTP